MSSQTSENRSISKQIKFLLVGFNAETNERISERFPKDVISMHVPTAAEGIELLNSGSTHILITIQDLPDMQGYELILNASKRCPDLNCILIVKPEFEVKLIEICDEISVFKVADDPWDIEYLSHILGNEIRKFQNKLKYKNISRKYSSAFNSMRENEARLRTLFNAPISVILLTDINGNVLNINEGGANLYDKTPQQIIGQNIFDFMPESVIGLKKQYTDQVINTGELIHFTFKHDGRYFDSSIYPVWDIDCESVLNLAIFSSNITDLKKAESEHNKLFNISFDLLCIAGKDGFFKELNPAWEKATGYSLEELYSRPFKEFIHPEDAGKTLFEIERILMGNVTLDFENRYITKSGEVLVLSWTAIALPEEGLIYCIARDITKLKQAENQAKEYQMRLKELAFELTISEERVRKQIAVDLHDHVGQMLSSIRMQMSQIIKNEESHDLKVRMDNISHALLKSIKATRAAIFDLSPPQLNEIGLTAAVHDWMNEQIERKHPININFSDKNDFFGLEENTRFLLFRSIKELVVNVVKHANAQNIFVKFENNNGMLEITVEDDGIGFNYNPNVLKLKSNTYGLFSIQERISDLGGIMEVESEINKGTKIKLSVPI